jgi:predicted DNA-binding protein (UPF0251 family)
MRKTDYIDSEKYVVYIRGAKSPNKKHSTLESAELEAIRLTALTRKQAFVAKLVSMFKAPSDKELESLKVQALSKKNKNKK